ncbi:MAG: hypothetical protein RLN99_05080, partial [Kiloniellaceae bacterium]
TAGSYQVNDAVAHLDASWIATAQTTEEPGDSAADWDLLAAQGGQGDPGADGSGVPAGGATGQTLRKASGAGGDVEWGYALVEISQAAYDLLSPPDASTIYFITS